MITFPFSPLPNKCYSILDPEEGKLEKIKICGEGSAKYFRGLNEKIKYGGGCAKNKNMLGGLAKFYIPPPQDLKLNSSKGSFATSLACNNIFYIF